MAYGVRRTASTFYNIDYWSHCCYTFFYKIDSRRVKAFDISVFVTWAKKTILLNKKITKSSFISCSKKKIGIGPTTTGKIRTSVPDRFSFGGFGSGHLMSSAHFCRTQPKLISVPFKKIPPYRFFFCSKNGSWSDSRCSEDNFDGRCRTLPCDWNLERTRLLAVVKR